MPYPVERLLEVHADVVETLLVLEVLLAQYPKVDDLLCCAGLKPPCSSAMTFSACGFSRFSKINSITLLGWLMRLTVR